MDIFSLIRLPRWRILPWEVRTRTGTLSRFAVIADTPFCRYTVHHETEVPYVYGLPSVAEANADSGVVSQAMVDYWVAFVVSGTPNDGKGLSSA